MFANLPLDVLQLYAVGMTLAIAWLIVTLQPGVRRLVSLLLAGRAPSWIDSITMLLQALALLSALFLIVHWLGTNTILGISVGFLLCLVVALLRRRPVINPTGEAQRNRALEQAQVDRTVVATPTVQSNMPTATHLAPDSVVSHALAEPTQAEPLVVVAVAERADPAPAILVPIPAPSTALVPIVPTPVSIPGPSEVTQPDRQTRRPIPLTRRPALGKKTTAGLLK